MSNMEMENFQRPLQRHHNIPVVELPMMDLRKYYPLTMASGFVVRGILYPLTLIKTRIQVQKQKAVYSGTWDAFTKIHHFEGFRGLYRGFWINNLNIVPQMFYITTYENVRNYLAQHTSLSNRLVRSFISGGCASCVAQTFVVPIDVVSQYLMLLGLSSGSKKSTVSHLDTLKLPQHVQTSRIGALNAICVAIYRRDGLIGFWKGYLASLSVYAPNSAMWWLFYDVYCGAIASVSPDWMPRLVLQCIAAPLGGMTSSLLTNPLDIIRARIQVERGHFVSTTKQLWKEEHLRIFSKGLSARLINSVSFSFFIILGYESIKRLSLLEEYKHQVQW